MERDAIRIMGTLCDIVFYGDRVPWQLGRAGSNDTMVMKGVKNTNNAEASGFCMHSLGLYR